MEDIIKEVISENLTLDEGITTAKMVVIDGDAIKQRKRLLNRRLATTSMITFEIQQAVVVGGNVDTDEEQLRQEVAEALSDGIAPEDITYISPQSNEMQELVKRINNS